MNTWSTCHHCSVEEVSTVTFTRPICRWSRVSCIGGICRASRVAGWTVTRVGIIGCATVPVNVVVIMFTIKFSTATFDVVHTRVAVVRGFCERKMYDLIYNIYKRYIQVSCNSLTSMYLFSHHMTVHISKQTSFMNISIGNTTTHKYSVQFAL